MYNNQGGVRNQQNFVKIVAIIHAALLIGQVLFGIVAVAETKSTGFNLKLGSDPFFYIVPFLTVAGMLSGNFLFMQKISNMADKNSLNEKLAGYQTALIIRFAISEGPSLFGIVGYMLSGNVIYLILVGINMLYFILIRPTKDKMAEDLDLTYEDKIAMGGR
jgi:hypothetical protein